MSPRDETSVQVTVQTSRPPKIVTGCGSGVALPTVVRVKGETMIFVIVVDRKWFTKILRKTKKTLQAVSTALKSLSE
jgi:hypothetical protein